MTKYVIEEKLEAVLEYLKGHKSYQTLAEERKMSMTPLKRWVLRYQKYGIDGLLSTYTNYDYKFKIDVLNYMNEFKASINETAAHFNIASDATVLNWKRQFEAGGIDALLPRKKGRQSMKKNNNKKANKQVPTEGSVEALQSEI